MKYFNKNTYISLALGLLLSVGLVYAANITSLVQTAAPGDKVTSTWVNAVNTKLGTVDAATGGYSDCYIEGQQNSTLTCSTGYTTVLGARTYNNGTAPTIYSSMGGTIAPGDSSSKGWYNPVDGSSWTIQIGSTSGAFESGTSGYLQLLKDGIKIKKVMCNSYGIANNGNNQYYICGTGQAGMSSASVQLCCK